jgi:hypothetical protein
VVFLAFVIGAQSSQFAQDIHTATRAQKATVRVPFVGCESDGQVGPVEAPRGQREVVAISANTAQRLAYYKSERGFGVLAPRGWHCFGTYGSNGSNLFVSQEPINAADLLSRSWKGISGQAIQVSDRTGDTSGRFEVAKTIARVFPAYSAFVQDVIAEGIEPASSFPSGPYSRDRLTYRNKETVEFQTPANTEGLGTQSWLQRNGSPINGVAILFGQEPNLLQLSLRLPPDADDLIHAIVQQAEREALNFGR